MALEGKYAFAATPANLESLRVAYVALQEIDQLLAHSVLEDKPYKALSEIQQITRRAITAIEMGEEGKP